MCEEQSLLEANVRKEMPTSRPAKPLALLPEFRGALGLSLLWSVLGTVLMIAQMFVLSNIISEIFLHHAGLARVVSLFLWLLLFVSGHALLIWVREVCLRTGTMRAQVGLRRRVFAHLLSLGPVWVQNERSGELVVILGEGIERLDAYLARYLPQMALSVVVPLMILLVIFPCDLLSALLLLLTAPLIPFLMMVIGSRAEQQSQAQWKALMHMSAHFLDVVQGLTTLKLFGRSQAEQERVARISESFREKTMSTLRLAFLSGAVLEFLTTMAIGLVAVVLGIRLIDHQITLRPALFVLLLAPEFYRPLRDLGSARHAGLEGKASAQRLSEILGVSAPTPRVPSTEAQDNLYTHGPVLWRGANRPLEITLRNIAYSYPGNEQPTLRDVSLTLPSGTCTALVGRSGAGKSTLARLLLRWLEADQGEITAAGVPIERISLADWRECIAWVPQRPYLFYGSVRENILLARPCASEEELHEAARLAGALEFIEHLPQGFATPVGEQGARLSAGQVQRIALARAFLKDAPLLILDEPTSSLDPESESLIRHALTQLMHGRTVLVIAHRLSTIAAASRVLVLEEGRIREAGAPPLWLRSAGETTDEEDEMGNKRIEKQDNARQHLVSPFPIPLLASAQVPEPVLLSATAPAPLSSNATPGQHSRSVLWRLLKMQTHLAGPALLAALLGCILVASNLGLLSIAMYLITASAVVSLLIVLTIPIFFVRLMGLVRPLARYGERCVSHDLTFRLLARLRTRVYACLEPLTPALQLSYRSGDLLTRLVADIDELQHLYLHLLAPLATAIGIILLTFFVLANFSWQLALVALVFLLLAAGVLPLFCWWLAHGLGTRQLELRAELKAVLLDGIQGLPDLLAYGQAQPYQRKIELLNAHLSRIQRHQSWIASAQEALTDLLKQGAIWSLLLLALPLVSSGELDGIYPGSLALLLLASFEIVPPLGQACQFLEHTQAAGRRLFTLLDAPPAVEESADPLPLPALIPGQGYELAFEHLDFSYSRKNGNDGDSVSRTGTCISYSRNGRNHRMKDKREQSNSGVVDGRILVRNWRNGRENGREEIQGGVTVLVKRDGSAYGENETVLKDICVRVRAGSRVALVGSSGAGKSTLLRLVLRSWDVEAGRITLNGEDVRRYAPDDLRELMGVVTQETYLFNATLRANLLLARPHASEEELMTVLDQARLGVWVRQLPGGLGTWIGEQGVRLSGGERQRLAIARALLKNAPILLLDEVTANLDLQTEQEVLSALHVLMQGRTVLLVTHRLIGMELMDEIVVLENGRIQEQGSHAHLLARQGRYARLWNIQQSVFSVSALEV